MKYDVVLNIVRANRARRIHTAENICMKVEENCSFKSFLKFNGDQLKVTAAPSFFTLQATTDTAALIFVGCN